jgi:hypothetical protein
MLVREWPARSAPGTTWFAYEDTTREVAFRAYQQLRELAATIAHRRPPPSGAQRILAQHQIAYRDLTGALAAIGDDAFDLTPAEGEWPLRTVIHHIALTERGFHALIHWAVRRRRGGDRLPIEMPDGFRDEVSEAFDESGSMSVVLSRYAALHDRVLADFVNLSDDDLDAPNLWWEGYDVPARFRMRRFDSHLREHTIQVDKTLAGIGRAPSEPERLARLIHHALGEVEGALLGAGGTEPRLQHTVSSDLATLAAALPA